MSASMQRTPSSPPPPQRRAATRWVWAVAWGLVGFSLAVALWTGATDAASEERRVEHAHLRLAEVVANDTARSLEAADQLLRSLVARIGANVAVDLSADTDRSNTQLLSIARYDATGALVAASRPSATRHSIAGGEIYEALRRQPTGMAYAGPSGVDPITNVVGWPIAQALLDGRGQLAGILVATLNPEYLTRFTRSLGVDAETTVTIIGTNARERMLAGAGASESKRWEPVIDRARSTPHGVFSGLRSEDGSASVIAFSRVNSHGASAVVATPLADAYAALRQRNERRALAATVGTMTLLALGLLGARGVRALEAARARAEAADRSKSEWLADVSHELRTPLNGILGFAEYLERRLTAPLERESAAHILASGRHLHSVVNGLLDFAKLESGPLDFFWTDEPLAPLIATAASPHRRVADIKGLEFAVTIDPALASHYRVDRTRLTSMLGNLLDNAVKFTEQGRVALDVRGSRAVPGAIEFVVTDTGPGIAEEHRKAVFERFRRGDTIGARRASGTGLGLAYVREIAQAMGGALELASVLGHGSTFVLRLPLPAVRSAERASDSLAQRLL